MFLNRQLDIIDKKIVSFCRTFIPDPGSYAYPSNTGSLSNVNLSFNPESLNGGLIGPCLDGQQATHRTTEQCLELEPEPTIKAPDFYLDCSSHGFRCRGYTWSLARIATDPYRSTRYTQSRVALGLKTYSEQIDAHQGGTTQGQEAAEKTQAAHH